jgi:hypothetical protein
MAKSHPEQRVLIEVDARGRCSLGRLGIKPGALFLGRLNENGEVILEPVGLQPLNNNKTEENTEP